MRPAAQLEGYSLPLPITIGIRLATWLCKISRVSFSSSFFKEGMHLVLELPQALVHEIQALPDLFAEIFF